VLAGLLDLVTASSWTYAAIVLVAAIDAVLPVMPSEAAVISAGALAGAGELSIAFVIAAAVGGAVLGDNGAYSIGRVFGPRLDARFERNERFRRNRSRAEQALAARSAAILLAARFVPGGRTATTLTAGLVRLRWARFLFLVLIAGTAWASGMGLLGYAGAHAIESHLYLGVASVVAAFAVVAGGRLAMPQIRARRRTRRLGS
jgi:membrane protein DedA with SNARE-associated domain